MGLTEILFEFLNSQSLERLAQDTVKTLKNDSLYPMQPSQFTWNPHATVFFYEKIVYENITLFHGWSFATFLK